MHVIAHGGRLTKQFHAIARSYTMRTNETKKQNELGQRTGQLRTIKYKEHSANLDYTYLMRRDRSQH